MAAPNGRSCPFNQQCLCSWRRPFSSPRIPSVAPGRDYMYLPTGGDNGAAWSLLVGFMSGTDDDVLRLHRFSVTQSGRILGHSNNILEVVADVDYKTQDTTWTHISCATAMPGSDGRSLCLFTRPIADGRDSHNPIRPLQLHLDADAADGIRCSVTVSTTLPDLPLGPERTSTRPISAAGHLWAPCFSEDFDLPRLWMKRLDKAAGKWEDVAAMNLQVPIEQQWSGRFLHGYAVVKDRTILLSLQQSGLFAAFDCCSGSWTDVLTTEDATGWENYRYYDYVPIHERGIYLEEDDTIYFLSQCTLYAYKLCQDPDGQYRMAPPIRVDILCPPCEDGCYGFVTHLGNRIMCSVWIGVQLRCRCDAKHALFTTFRVQGDSSHGHFVPRGVKIIHSTCRQLDISPHKPSDSHCEFLFLREFAEIGLGNSTMPKGMAIATNSCVVESSKMLACCRKFLNETPLHSAVMLEDSTFELNNKVLYIIGQTSSHSNVYKIDIINGRLMCITKTLTPLSITDKIANGDGGTMMERPLPWHFVCSSTHIYAVPYIENEVYQYSLCSGALTHDSVQCPVEDPIALVIQVGEETIGISGNFQCVYRLTFRYGWKRINTTQSFAIKSMIQFSGYVVLSDSVIVVSDAEMGYWYLLDIRSKRWSHLPSSWSEGGTLSGRSVFVDGFIYTCANGGLAAFEVIERGGVYYPGRNCYLKFSWRKYWESYRMCLDYIGKDNISGSNVFCVVQGGDYNGRPGRNPLCITIVQVKTKTQGLEWKQVIDHVDFGTSYVEEKRVWTSNCFAVDP